MKWYRENAARDIGGIDGDLDHWPKGRTSERPTDAKQELPMSISDERDAQIAVMIRTKIRLVETERERLGYRLGSPEDACIQGQMMGLRLALAFIDPHPQS